MSFKKYIKENELEQAAKDFAIDKHSGQKRKFRNVPYISHPMEVAKTVKEYGGTSEMIAAAWLHDVLEDVKNITVQDIIDNFGDKVANLVVELTNKENIKGPEKGQYLLDKMLTMSDDALTIKLADRLNNVSDFETAPPTFIAKYKPQTELILSGLTKRSLNKTHQKLIDNIKEIIIKYET